MAEYPARFEDDTGGARLVGNIEFTDEASEPLPITGGVLTGTLQVPIIEVTANAAPADATLAAGELALWFDDTNGAGKLMIKAKTADGTVVTGNVALA